MALTLTQLSTNLKKVALSLFNSVQHASIAKSRLILKAICKIPQWLYCSSTRSPNITPPTMALLTQASREERWVGEQGPEVGWVSREERWAEKRGGWSGLFNITFRCGSVGVHGHQYWVVCKARLDGVFVSNGMLGVIVPCYVHL